jgi:predicted acylesterase/phospholipase RssA
VAETGLRRLLAQELSGRRLEDGRPGAYVVATEMGSGRACVIAVGDATEALLARAALPEVFPPVTIEGYFLVDVGSATSLPVAPAETLGATDVNVLAAAVPGRLAVRVGHRGGDRRRVARATNESSSSLDGGIGRHLERSVGVLTESLAVVVAAVSGPRDGTYVRSAALFDRVELDLEADAGGVGDGQLALSDLKFIDEAMASLAATMTLTVANYDTAVVDDAR